MRSRWFRLLPIMMVAFIIAFMDRTNISFAIPSMGKDLTLTASVLGFAAGVLFLGYGLSQTIGGWIADKGHGKALIACLLILWGLVEIAQGFIHTATELVIVRFALGLFEGGIFPAFLLFVKNWFAPSERARANGGWQLCYPLAALLSGPIAGYILRAGDWRDLFIIEGLFPIVWAIVWVWGVADSPQNAKWLSPAERDSLVRHLEREAQNTILPTDDAPPSYWAQMARRPVVLFTIAIFFWNIGFLGFIIWLPSVISQHNDLGPTETGWLSALPFAASIVVMQVLTFLSDKTGDRRVISVLALTISGLALMLGGLTYETNSLAMNMLLLIVAGGALYGSQPVLWSIPPDILPTRVAATVMGTINAVGVFGGFVGPYVIGFARSLTGSFSAGLWVMGSCLIVASLLVWRIRESSSRRLLPVADTRPV